jgi:uncharacterized membrane protein (DUF373 family)
MLKFSKLFERVVIIILMTMMSILIVLATLDLGRKLVVEIISSPAFIPDINQLLDIFGYFLLILIGVELLETIKAYLTEHVVHVEIVIEVALIAIARKLIILDIKELGSDKLFAVAALVGVVALAFYLEKLGRSIKTRAQEPEKIIPPTLPLV